MSTSVKHKPAIATELWFSDHKSLNRAWYTIMTL